MDIYFPEPESGNICSRSHSVLKSLGSDGGLLVIGAMGKHFSDVELDHVQAWSTQGMTSKDIHARLARARAPTGDRGPSLPATATLQSPHAAFPWRAIVRFAGRGLPK